MLVLSLPGLLLILALLFAQRSNMLQLQEQQALMYANQVATLQHAEIAATRRLLQQLAYQPKNLQHQRGLCPQLLSSAQHLSPSFANFGLATPDGTVTCSLSKISGPISIADRPYFQQAIDEGTFSIGEYQHDRSINTATLNFAHPVYQDGQLAMVIIAVKRLSHWSRSLSRLTLPQGTRVMVADHTRAIVAEYPYSNEPLGRAVAEDWPDGLNEQAVLLSDANGHHHVYIRLPLLAARGELTIYFAFPFEAAWQQTQRHFALVLSSFFVLLCLLIWLARHRLHKTLLQPLTQFRQAIAALAQGRSVDLTSHTMPQELAKLGEHFESMAKVRLHTEQQLSHKHTELQTLLSALPDSYLRVDAQGQVLAKHGSLVQQGNTLSELFPNHIHKRIRVALTLLKDQPHLLLEYTQGDNQQGYEVRVQGMNHGEEAVIVIRDISHRKRQEEALNLAALVYNNSSEGMVITDAHGYILDVNLAFETVTGFSAQEAIGKTTAILNSGKHDRAFYRQMWHGLNETGRWQGEIVNQRKNGELYTEWLTIDTVYDEQDSPYRRVAIFTDITDNKLKDEQLWRQSHYDSLTDLPNRNSLKKHLNTLLATPDTSLAILLLDLDHFKDINDTLGHYYGDQLLAQVAKVLQSLEQPGVTLSRIGGDEFVIICEHCRTESDAIALAERVLNLFKQDFTLDGEHCHIGASIGIALSPRDGDSSELLLKAADQAMYRAKALGRNGYACFDSALRQQSEQRLLMLRDMRQALSDAQFVMYYQPIVTMHNQQIHKAEALIRWQHPDKGMISPAHFIPLAEETQLIHQLGEFAFQQTLQTLSHLQQQHGAFQISLNVSPVQFNAKHTSLLKWQDQLNDADLQPEDVVIEITEGLMMQGEGRSQARLGQLIQQGFSIALDDFGTGYSSLAYLKQMDTDFIKIDKRFVDGIEHNEDDLVLCETMIMMAHQLGLKVIAEGIETATQHELLKQAGCDFGQGYFYAKPMSQADLEALLLDKSQQR
ncbi:EAL domain-containing protein [Pseudoalteromonas ardens]|uniref:bifunctional diguanylate cyclase/phosphodiesterase n=1 Tax=Pseudoalteromonas ardens TaxID=3048490 RepID=UPI0024C36C34|nr:EAL domain-containing protein [Pseudoalteromonas sp. R96]MDK1312516.1 EAL domain-containing protein [Pseudoalteromonas sp. R96]